MKKMNTFAARVAAIIVLVVLCISSASAQGLIKSNGVKFDALHGSSNWYAAAKYAYGINGGESYLGAEAGRRFNDHFRLGIEGMWCLTQDITQHHSYVVLKPSFDLVSSNSEFYQNTCLDVSISGLVGAMAQAKGMQKFQDDNGVPQLHDIACRPHLTYGASISLNCNVVTNVQVRIEASYLFASEEKKFANNIDNFCNSLSEADCQWVKSGNWIKNQILVGASIAYHF